MRYPLLTERLSIQPLELRDLDSFVRYRQDPEIAKFQSWEPTYSMKQGLELLESQVNVLVPIKGEWLQLAVHARTNGELLGDLAIHSLEENNSVFEIGFTFAKEHQGKGFAKEAASRLLEQLFAELGTVKVIANTDSRNQSSINLLLALGFENQPGKSWTEEFKNETVSVLCFEKTRP